MRTILTGSALALMIAATCLPAAAQAGPWAMHHPRQAEVLGRVHNQERRISDERREGELTRGQARALRADDRAIARQDHADARANGGGISRAEQRALNGELNAESRTIGR